MAAFLVILLFTYGCGRGDVIPTPSKIETGEIDLPVGGSPNRTYRFAATSLPLSIVIEDQFDRPQITHILEMMTEWENTSKSEFTFFDTHKVEAISDYPTLEQYDDAIMGIYLNHRWFSELGSNVLAVTQYFGTLNSDNTVTLVHADIIVNARDNVFSVNPVKEKNEFDLASVVLHELGHFIGLPHHFNFSSNTVMYPSISPGLIKRTLAPIDIANIVRLYPETLRDPSSQLQSAESKPGKRIRGIIEMTKNGECIHSENGQEIYRHFK